MERVEVAIDFANRENAELAYDLLKALYDKLTDILPTVGSHCFLKPVSLEAVESVAKAA